MKHKIYLQFCLIAALAILITTTIVTALFYQRFKAQVFSDVRTYAYVLTSVDTYDEATLIQEVHQLDNLRVTIIDKEGKVLLDTNADIGGMENHSNREEIKAAFETGEGQAVRQSKTVAKSTFYYAVRMNDGNVLRVATETGSVLSIVQGMLPIIAVMVVILFVICTFLGRLLTDSLLRPIEQMAENMDYVNEIAVYQEMEPFIDTIRRQHEDILKNASMRIGRSNLTASGSVYGLYAAMKKGKMLKANLEIASRNLDCNQLINALNFPQDTLQAETDTVSSSEPMQLFVIPKNIDFELKTNLKKVTYGNMVFENVKGAVDIRNQAVYLKKLTMRGLEADLETTLVYRARRKTRGYAGFDFRLRKVNIGKLVDFIPSLDTIVPMLRSFKGMVDFDATAEAVLDSNLNVKIPSLKAAMHIKGDSLVLMDGETFAEISKTLMFKNKKRNVFDSISVNLTVQDGNVTVYPFLLQIDRYKAAVGGTQGLDMNFNYHISVLKSPLPFKAGVNITGNLDKMKIRIGKAKYKDAVTPVEIRKVDSTRVNMGQEIIHSFEHVISRTYRGKLPQGAE
mgnify:CR=1 FL=1